MRSLDQIVLPAGVLALLVALSAPVPAQEGPSVPPNILLLYSDDTSYYTVSSYGDPMARTPVLGALAAEGMVLEQGMTNALYCKPSRNTLLTSLYPHQHGWITNTVEVPAPAPSFYLPQLLSAAGYHTHGVGKWHSSFSPAQAGFDGFNETFGLSPVPGVKQFLKTQTNPKTPWFLYVPFYRTHGPWEDPEIPRPWQTRPSQTTPPPPLRPNVNVARVAKPVQQDAFQAEGFRKLRRQYLDPQHPARILFSYFRDARDLDKEIHAILSTLDQLGLADNTVVVYTADQGVMGGNHYLWYKGPAVYEEMVHVPLIVRWPGVVSAGSTTGVSCGTIDLAPTLLDVGGAFIPHSFRGQSVLPTLQGGTQGTLKFQVVQSATDPPNPRQIRALRTQPDMFLPGQWKIILNEGDLDELYDLKNDPFEITNLAADPDYAATFAQLHTLLVGWMIEQGDPALPIFQ